MVAMALGQTGSTVLPTRTSTWKRSRTTWSAAISDTTTNEMRVAGFIGASDVLPGRTQPNVSDVVIGQLPARTAAAFARHTIGLIRARRRPVRTITADNGTELTGFRLIERRTGTRFYFATPYHAWERGTNGNTNGLIREFLPKGQSMARLTQPDCTRIARQLNRCPRKRLGYRTPEECYAC
jgi:IS30 family transposase